MEHFLGKQIQNKLKERNMSVTDFAHNLGIRRTNVYRDVFEQTSLDTNLLMRISAILQYDFFADLSEQHRCNSDSSD